MNGKREVDEQLRARMKEEPLVTLRLDLINKCNLRCVMCHYSDPEIALRPAKSITVEQFDQWFREIGPSVKDIMLSCGDEPLMSPHFVEILEKISSYGDCIDVGICTNAMLMNERIRSAMIRYGLTYALFSIDGATKATMERIRVKSSFDRVVANIKALSRLKEVSGSIYPKFVFDFVMMRSNIHEAEAYMEMCNEMGAELVDFRHAISSSYWNDPDERLENFPEVYNYYRERIVDRATSLGVPVTLPSAFEKKEGSVFAGDQRETTLSDFHAVAADPHGGPIPVPKTMSRDFRSRKPLDLANEYFGKTYCERPFSEVMIRNQTEVLPCAWHGKVMGELKDGESLEAIFLGENFLLLREKMLRGEVDPGCRHCPVKSGFLPTEVVS